MKDESLNVSFFTNVKIIDVEKNQVLVDKSNAIHTQNMARAIARALASEPNSIIYRIAFGNGGSFEDIGGNTILRPPNDGTQGDGWESRLYNETYSEILVGPDVGTDPGSWGPNSQRIGGGASPENDPENNSVVSNEAGLRSVVTATCFLNPSEPISQLPSTANENSIAVQEKTFSFDELGFYTPGLPAESTRGILRVDVGNKNSDSLLPANMRDKSYTFVITVNGVQVTQTINIPDIPNLTFGDLCEGLNTGAWTTGPSNPLMDNLSSVYITERSTTNSYPTITGRESFGFLVFESGLTGISSTVTVAGNQCNTEQFLYDLTEGNCVVNSSGTVVSIPGVDRGVQNSSADATLERERLLTHITFSPILKKANRTLKIVYNLTVSVAQVKDTVVDIVS